MSELAPKPYSRYRVEVLERYPPGHPRHELIKALAQRWATTGQWVFRRKMGSLAGALVEDAEVVSDPVDDRDTWLTAECMADLAESCRKYLGAFENYVEEK